MKGRLAKVSHHASFMDLALGIAKEAGRLGEIPIGAMIVESRSREILASAGNQTEATNDPTAHAEMVVIRAATARCGTPRLEGCDLYVTLEPCPMCAQAISFARLRRLYYGCEDAKGGGVTNGARIFNQASCHHCPEVYGGIGETQAAALLQSFFKARR